MYEIQVHLGWLHLKIVPIADVKEKSGLEDARIKI